MPSFYEKFIAVLTIRQSKLNKKFLIDFLISNRELKKNFYFLKPRWVLIQNSSISYNKKNKKTNELNGERQPTQQQVNNFVVV